LQLNLGIYLKDNTTDFSVLVDRALGGSSIVDGEIELMLHRRLLYDDRRGVGEALNETVCNSNGNCEGLTVQGSFSVYIGPSEQSAQWRRVHGQQVLMPLQFAFSVLEDGNEAAIRSPQFSAMQPFYELPPNVAIITLQEVYEDDDSKVLIRLANIFEVGDTQQTPSKTYFHLWFGCQLNLSGECQGHVVCVIRVYVNSLIFFPNALVYGPCKVQQTNLIILAGLYISQKCKL
jgi:hypothetical protein